MLYLTICYAEGIGNPAKIREAQIKAVRAYAYKRLSVKQISLSLPYAVISLIVDKEYLNRHPVACYSLQLLKIHHDGTVTCRAYNIMLIV